jgi:hypothetical protein
LGNHVCKIDLNFTNAGSTHLRIPKDEDSKEVRSLQVKLFKALKGSNAPAHQGRQRDEAAELAKASYDEGLEIARLMNGQVQSQTMRIV